VWKDLSIREQEIAKAANRKKAIESLLRSRERMQSDNTTKLSAHGVQNIPVGTIVEVRDEKNLFSHSAVVIEAQKEYILT
jgi:hypothetical protein